MDFILLRIIIPIAKSETVDFAGTSPARFTCLVVTRDKRPPPMLFEYRRGKTGTIGREFNFFHEPADISIGFFSWVYGMLT